MSYEHNIFWSDIPKDAQIYDMGSSWVVHMPDGRKGLVYWTGETAGSAQRMLKVRAMSKDRIPKEEPKKKEPNYTLAAQRKDVKRIRREHPEIYGKSPGSCTIVCKFPRRR